MSTRTPFPRQFRRSLARTKVFTTTAREQFDFAEIASFVHARMIGGDQAYVGWIVPQNGRMFLAPVGSTDHRMANLAAYPDRQFALWSPAGAHQLQPIDIVHDMVEAAREWRIARAAA